MRTLGFVSLSGGQGKTTCSFFVGLHLARRGLAVLWVDGDPQHNLSLLSGVEVEGQRTLNEVLRNQRDCRDCIYGTGWENLYILPSGDSLSGVNEFLASTGNGSRILARRLRSVAAAFDVCVIDAPPSRSQITISVVGASAEVVIPFEVSVKGTNCLMSSVRFLRDLGDMDAWSGRILGVVPFRAKWFGLRQLRDGRENLEAVRGYLAGSEVRMFPSILESAQFQSALRQGVTLSDLGHSKLDYPFLEIVSSVAVEVACYATS
jgi:chromosome partitioning protein